MPANDCRRSRWLQTNAARFERRQDGVGGTLVRRNQASILQELVQVQEEGVPKVREEVLERLHRTRFGSVEKVMRRRQSYRAHAS